MPPIRTLIVDDSALVRSAVASSLSRDAEIEVVGTAIDPYVARDKILALDPDVITLDIEMPRMDGLTFLKLIMKHRPMPVVVMSSLTRDGSAKALEALQAGAVEVIAKPGSTFSVADAAELAAKVKAAAQSRCRRVRTPTAQPAISRSATSECFPAAGQPGVLSPSSPTEPNPSPSPTPVPMTAQATGTRLASRGRHYSNREVILMGASTGGTEALKTVLCDLPTDLPGICIVQHIPAYFSAAFAGRLDQLCWLEVREARQGDLVRPGLVLIAPGGEHMVLRWTGSEYFVSLNRGPAIHHQRPAVDVLFDSAVKAGAGRHALAVLLTGMGSDGAAGMARLRAEGAQTIAQDEASCVVFGMPRAAIELGAANEVLALDRIGARIDRHAQSIALPHGIPG